MAQRTKERMMDFVGRMWMKEIFMALEKSKLELISTKPPDGWAAHEHDHVAIRDQETGKVYHGKIRLKAVNCGKPNCTKCPHHIYAYAQFRKGKKVTEKYLGVAR